MATSAVHQLHPATTSSLDEMQRQVKSRHLSVPTSTGWIGNFCNPNPVQYFHCEIQSDPNPIVLSKNLIQFGFYPKKLGLNI